MREVLEHIDPVRIAGLGPQPRRGHTRWDAASLSERVETAFTTLLFSAIGLTYAYLAVDQIPQLSVGNFEADVIFAISASLSVTAGGLLWQGYRKYFS